MKHKVVAVGEVLWDMLPDGPQLGGAPANFAYHCRALGTDARLVTRVGRDDLGRDVFDRFHALHLLVDTVQIDQGHPTGTVQVRFEGGQPHYSILEGVAWDEIEADAPALALARSADAICFGSLAQRSSASRRAIRSLVAATRPGTFRIFDVNLRPPFVDQDVISASLGLANILKLNDHELTVLAAMFGLDPETRPAMSGLARCFGLSLVALTRGDAGSLLMAGDIWSDYPGNQASTLVADTIGAGDSFTAALVVGLLAGHPLEAINRHANEVAAFVCSQPGGTPALPESLRSARSATTVSPLAPACVLPVEIPS